MKLKKKNLKALVLLSSTLMVVACGKMQANLEQPSGILEHPSSMVENPNYSDSEFFMEASEAIEVRETQPSSNAESEAEAPSEGANPKPPVKPGIPAPPQAEMNGPGVLKPTVYYFPIINEDKNPCSSKTILHGAGGKNLLSVCTKTAEACSLQGSCAVVQKGKTHTFNIIGRFDGQDRYFEIDEKGCRFGYGVNSSCLDPFYTLAADLTIYKPGEVIFVPAVVGLILPDGSKHSGYFVIRDQGRGIKGRGRFDFFSGYFSWLDPKNPFNKLGLGDVNTNIPYFRINGETAKRVLLHRSYPQLPANATGGTPSTK